MIQVYRQTDRQTDMTSNEDASLDSFGRNGQLCFPSFSLSSSSSEIPNRSSFLLFHISDLQDEEKDQNEMAG